MPVRPPAVAPKIRQKMPLARANGPRGRAPKSAVKSGSTCGRQTGSPPVVRLKSAKEFPRVSFPVFSPPPHLGPWAGPRLRSRPRGPVCDTSCPLRSASAAALLEARESRRSAAERSLQGLRSPSSKQCKCQCKCKCKAKQSKAKSKIKNQKSKSNQITTQTCHETASSSSSLVVLPCCWRWCCARGGGACKTVLCSSRQPAAAASAAHTSGRRASCARARARGEPA